jgi:hypothetical protein
MKRHCKGSEVINMKNIIIVTFFIICSAASNAQAGIDSFRMYGDVRITMDIPEYKYRHTLLIFFALPNGNTTEQTMGKKMEQGDDWHFDIQHIKAQTDFLREKINSNIVVAYLENKYRSWPSWKQKHPAFRNEIPHIVDTITGMIKGKSKTVYLNGHSGGGSFVFGYLDGIEQIPAIVQRICFLDSDYGYDSSYYPKLKTWLQGNKNARLTVFAYNDSVALYEGKPVVSEKGGTWYRSHLMMHHLEDDLHFNQTRNDSLIFYRSTNNQVAFFFKTNPERKIFHTQQVELNGFIHSVLFGTKKENEGYEYFGKRAYTQFIK